MDDSADGNQSRFKLKMVLRRFLKATIKTLVVFVPFLLLSMFMDSFQSFYQYQTVFTVFFAAYLAFVFLIELTKGTILQHVFGFAHSFMFVFYFANLMNDFSITLPVEQMNLIVDLGFFVAVFAMGGLLGLLKGILQFLDWMNEREEHWLKGHIRSL